MSTDHDTAAARRLAEDTGRVEYKLHAAPWREIVQRLHGPFRWHRERFVVAAFGTAWWDSACTNLPGWRTRSGHIDGVLAFQVHYQICRGCHLGWVEDPYTHHRYRRNGLATTALATLRREYPDLSWHTLTAHIRDSYPFWAAAGADVTGGYQQHEMCVHFRD